MKLLAFIILIHLFMDALFLCFCASMAQAHHGALEYHVQDEIARTITVDKSGQQGDFTSVQEAIDSIPQHNTLWTLIHVKAGIYHEKVKVPREKPFIVLNGENQAGTVIQWGDAGDVIESSTFQLFAENFVARHITFKNTFNAIIPGGDGDGSKITWAPAALLHADKATFYQCGFIGLQDTLTDSAGRHFFKACYIQGAVDFIWSGGQSIYQKCTINATAELLGKGLSGYITAQGRNSTADTGGFVFSYCNVVGTGATYLGRPFGKYSRVIFYKTALSDVIVPEGWASWSYSGQEDSITYAEVGCTGPGAIMSKRVKWLKKLAPAELRSFTDIGTFLNKEGWMDKQPKLPTIFL